MKSMKKNLCFLLTLIMCVGMFASCGVYTETNNGSDDTTAATSTTAPTKEAAAGDSTESSDATATAAPEDTAVTEKSLPPMTTDEITLTYLNFDQDETTQYLAQKFMEKYPNITVNAQYLSTSGYNDTLLNMTASGQTPDAFMFLGNCDFVLSNQIVGDMTEYWENDPENDNILPTINECKIGYYGTDSKWATPIKFFPDAVYLDMTVFENLNLDMPDMNWSWSDMIDTIKAATDMNQSPAYYGLACYHSMVTYYPIASSPSVIGEFGWDGNSFNMDLWAVGLQTYADLINANYVSPNRDSDEMEAWMGDFTLWQGDTGHVAMMFEAFWTYMNLWNEDSYVVDKNIKFVPYVIPADYEVADDEVWNSFGILDMGGISSGTEHPREAYELLKFMGWGVEGWNARLELYSDDSIVNAAGNPLRKDVMPAPITLDSDVWSAFRQMYPTDEERGPYWDYYFAHCTRPITWGSNTIPGFDSFIANAYSGVEQAVFDGASAYDYAEELTQKANEYNSQAMSEIFGQ